MSATGKGTELKCSSQSREQPMRKSVRDTGCSRRFFIQLLSWFELIQLHHKSELTLRTSGRPLGGEQGSVQRPGQHTYCSTSPLAPLSSEEPLAFNSHDGNTCRRQHVWCLGALPLCECLLTTCWSSWHLSSPLSPRAGIQETPETTGKQLCSAQTCWYCCFQRGCGGFL